MIFFIPFFLVVGLLILIFDGGPIFFRQIRVGKNQVPFSIWKFKTMSPKKRSSSLITIGDNDPRVTKIGKILRKTKIDELPQLINVFLGDMSLVGPRPEVPKYVKFYNKEQLKVFDVRPGITDLASIEYRNESELLKTFSDPEKGYIEEVMPAKLKLNLKYIQTRSMLNDFKIILRTLRSL